MSTVFNPDSTNRDIEKNFTKLNNRYIMYECKTIVFGQVKDTAVFYAD